MEEPSVCIPIALIIIAFLLVVFIQPVIGNGNQSSEESGDTYDIAGGRLIRNSDLPRKYGVSPAFTGEIVDGGKIKYFLDGVEISKSEYEGRRGGY